MHCVISQILSLVLKTAILRKISTEERAKKKEEKKKETSSSYNAMNNLMRKSRTGVVAKGRVVASDTAKAC